MLINNWRKIAVISYTAWAFYALALVTLLPDAIYKYAGYDTNPAVWSMLQLAIIVLGLIGRMIDQPKESAWRRRIIVALIVIVTVVSAVPALAQTNERKTMAVLIPLVTKWEGEHRCKDNRRMHCAYRDIVGVPTICFGETKGVRIGQRATDKECRQKLKSRLAGSFRAGLHRYFSEETKAQRLTPERDAAYVSLAYNVGVRGAGKSTAVRRLNKGNILGGCRAIGWWNKAGGRVVRGLVNRRSEEVALCLRGA